MGGTISSISTTLTIVHSEAIFYAPGSISTPVNQYKLTISFFDTNGQVEYTINNVLMEINSTTPQISTQISTNNFTAYTCTNTPNLSSVKISIPFSNFNDVPSEIGPVYLSFNMQVDAVIVSNQICGSSTPHFASATIPFNPDNPTNPSYYYGIIKFNS